MTPSLDELLARVRPYRRTDDVYASRHERSPEDERLYALWTQEEHRLEQWEALLAQLRADLPRYRIEDVSHPRDAGLRCTLDPPVLEGSELHRQVVVGCLSLLAPVYMVYGLQYPRRGHRSFEERRLFFNALPHSMLRPAAVLARRLEARFGVIALPPELAATPVPFYVDWREPPHTTLFHALFSSEPDNVP
jgi:hypothetical protein